MWPVVSSPQNVRHFLCKHQEEWLPREQKRGLQALHSSVKQEARKVEVLNC